MEHLELNDLKTMAFPLAVFENLHHHPDKVREYLQQPSGTLPSWFLTDVFDGLQALLYAFHELRIAQTVYAIERANAAEAALITPTDFAKFKEQDEGINDDLEFWGEGIVARLFSGKRDISDSLPPQSPLFSDRRCLSYGLPPILEQEVNLRTIISQRSTSYDAPSLSSSPRTLMSRPTSSIFELSPATSITTLSPATSPNMSSGFGSGVFDPDQHFPAPPSSPCTPMKSQLRKSISNRSMFPARRSSLTVNTKLRKHLEVVTPTRHLTTLVDEETEVDIVDGFITTPNHNLNYSNLDHAPRFHIDSTASQRTNGRIYSFRTERACDSGMDYSRSSPIEDNNLTGEANQHQSSLRIYNVSDDLDIFGQKQSQFPSNVLGLRRSASTGSMRDLDMLDTPSDGPALNGGYEEWKSFQDRDMEFDIVSNQNGNIRSRSLVTIPEQDMDVLSTSNSTPLPQGDFTAFKYGQRYDTPMTPSRSPDISKGNTAFSRIASAARVRTKSPWLAAKKSRRSFTSPTFGSRPDTSTLSISSLTSSLNSSERPISATDNRPSSHISVPDEEKNRLDIDGKALRVLGFESMDQLARQDLKMEKKKKVDKIGEIVSEGLKMG